MVCQHDLRLAVLAILISMMAAFAARELLGRINKVRGQVWLPCLLLSLTLRGKEASHRLS
jgi:NO-binding membrane sensor protein with MHYT domain